MAGGPMIVPSIQMEKKMAFIPPSRMRGISSSRGVALAQVVVLREKALRGVVVRIQNDGREVQLMGAFGKIVSRSETHRQGRETRTEHQAEQN